MEDYELKIAIQDQDNENSYYVGSFECHASSLASAIAIASNELGFIRVIQVINNNN